MDVCSTVYSETKAFYETNALACGALGYQILYGPPFIHPPILFLGYQPGGGVEDYRYELSVGSQDHWPDTCEYAVKEWRLAKNMQSMFGASLLKECVGLNAIFVRSPNIETYRRNISAPARRLIKEFCIPRVEQIIAATQPALIVAIGFETLALFQTGEVDLVNDKGRCLTRHGTITGRAVIATLHLSGAHISSTDRSRIAQRILGVTGPHRVVQSRC